MKKLWNKIIAGLLVFTGVTQFIDTAQAHPDKPEADINSVSPQFDPISATLDSLVNLNYIQRLGSSSISNSTGNNFQLSEVPVYSDDVYRSRIEKIPTPIPLAYNDEIKNYIDLYATRRRALTERVMGLANFYFPLYEQIMDQQGIPLEFKYLSIVESALNPMAVSRVGATGLWQFMLGTGKLYKLKINSLVDERRDPVKATMAACQYFKDMYSIYNDWLLVIAAYNCGAGNVNRAIARSGGKKTFWEISQYLPRETRGYVPAFIAVTYLMNYSAEHNLTAVPPLVNYFESDTVMVDYKITFREIADAIHVPVELLSYLNPVYKRGVIPDAEEPQPLRLPSGKINLFYTNLDNIFHQENEESSMLASSLAALAVPVSAGGDAVKKIHRVKKGERLPSIAMIYRCSVNEIKSWNNLRSGKLFAGQRLTVYVNAKKKSSAKYTSVPVQSKDRNNHSSALPAAKTSGQSLSSNTLSKGGTSRNTVSGKTLKTIYHVVQAGDTLWKIAQRYEGTTVEQIMEMNGLQSDNLQVGTRLKVPVGA